MDTHRRDPLQKPVSSLVKSIPRVWCETIVSLCRSFVGPSLQRSFEGPILQSSFMCSSVLCTTQLDSSVLRISSLSSNILCTSLLGISLSSPSLLAKGHPHLQAGLETRFSVCSSSFLDNLQTRFSMASPISVINLQTRLFAAAGL
ncbi:hypothetical protein ILYODFUR_023042 [Ilyodon furcidens]|uniref:Uncharacterized protein n=1 Tax=Ilyodon furcidens TaxID=33524 RepID=A0ABV0VH00_9TELE